MSSMLPSYQKNLMQGRFETWTMMPETNCYHVHQVHGVRIAHGAELPCEADGISLTWDEVQRPVAIKTADCLPVLIEGKTGVVFLHAGWRGLAAGILAQKSIQEIFPDRCLIGPAIQKCCFEVSADFKNNFPDSGHFEVRGDKLYFDLVAEAKTQLKKNNPELTVETANICTACDNKFHSFRKTKTTLRNWNLYIKG